SVLEITFRVFASCLPTRIAGRTKDTMKYNDKASRRLNAPCTYQGWSRREVMRGLMFVFPPYPDSAAYGLGGEYETSGNARRRELRAGRTDCADREWLPAAAFP